jgi:hypothetical protein
MNSVCHAAAWGYNESVAAQQDMAEEQSDWEALSSKHLKDAEAHSPAF